MKTIVLCLCGSWALFCAAAAEWRDISPDGGRVLHIAVDPRNSSTVYAAACADLFKSTDSGAHWSSTARGPLSNCQTFLPGITIDPRNPGTLYATGCGSSKSIDGGATWKAIDVTGEPANCIGSIAIDPSNSTTLYAAGTRIYKSTNNGDTWTATSDYGVDGAWLLVDPANPANIYATAYLRGIFRSADAGATWTVVTTGLSARVEALALDPVHSGTLYAGSGGKILRSADAGATWEQQTAGLPPAPADNCPNLICWTCGT